MALVSCKKQNQIIHIVICIFNLCFEVNTKSLKVFRLKAAILGLQFVKSMMFNCGNPREPKGTSLGDPWWSLVTPFYKWCEWKNIGKFPKNRGKWIFFFQKTETESWGLPLMNGGLKNSTENFEAAAFSLRMKLVIYCRIQTRNLPLNSTIEFCLESDSRWPIFMTSIFHFCE